LLLVLRLIRRASGSTLFPYTTLFRSWSGGGVDGGDEWVGGSQRQRRLRPDGGDGRPGSVPHPGAKRPGPGPVPAAAGGPAAAPGDRKSTCLNSSHVKNSYAVFCLKKKNDGGIRHRNRGRCPARPPDRLVADGLCGRLPANDRVQCTADGGVRAGAGSVVRRRCRPC